MLAAVTRISLPATIVCVILVMLTYPLRGLRLQIFLHAIKPIGFGRLSIITLIGFAANNILPARLGELVRVFYLSRREKYPLSASLGSLVVERWLDVIFFALFGCLPLISFSAEQLDAEIKIIGISVRSIATGSLYLFIASFTIFVLFSVKPDSVKALLLRIMEKLPAKWKPFLRQFIENIFPILDFTRSPIQILKTVFYSFTTLSCYITVFWIICRPLAPGFSWLGSGYVMAVLAAGISVPSVPGYIGPMHLAISIGLSSFAIPDVNAGAIAILYHAICYVPTTLFGILFFLKNQVSLKEIKEA